MENNAAPTTGGKPDPEGGKVDPITALQDGIDGLSLSMFEALRSLRDAVAPESGNLGGNNPANAANNSSANAASAAAGGGGNESSSAVGGEQPDMDELWSLYRSGDREITAKIQKFIANSNSGSGGGGGQVLLVPQKREDFVRLHAKMEMEKDTELVTKLASTVLEKSAQIDQQVDALPGMNRTREDQMKIIEGLIALNQKAAQDLHKAYREAVERRAACRNFIQTHTCTALGIDEEPERHDK